jgi:hypothetical protein
MDLFVLIFYSWCVGTLVVGSVLLFGHFLRDHSGGTVLGLQAAIAVATIVIAVEIAEPVCAWMLNKKGIE